MSLESSIDADKIFQLEVSPTKTLLLEVDHFVKNHGFRGIGVGDHQ